MKYPTEYYWLVAVDCGPYGRSDRIVRGCMEANLWARREILRWMPAHRVAYQHGIYGDAKHPKGVAVALVDLGQAKPKLSDDAIKMFVDMLRPGGPLS